MDTLSRNNRVFIDAFIRHLATEIRSFLPFDETWYDVQLPFYVGQHKGEIQISGKSSCDFKTAKEVLHKDDVQFFTEFIKAKKSNHQHIMRGYFSEVFNDSTTSCLN